MGGGVLGGDFFVDLFVFGIVWQCLVGGLIGFVVFDQVGDVGFVGFVCFILVDQYFMVYDYYLVVCVEYV